MDRVNLRYILKSYKRIEAEIEALKELLDEEITLGAVNYSREYVNASGCADPVFAAVARREETEQRARLEIAKKELILKQIKRTLKLLNEEELLMIDAHLINNMPIYAVADKTRYSEWTVKRRINKALDTMAAHINNYET